MVCEVLHKMDYQLLMGLLVPQNMAYTTSICGQVLHNVANQLLMVDHVEHVMAYQLLVGRVYAP